jgi:hypothetical protein
LAHSFRDCSHDQVGSVALSMEARHDQEHVAGQNPSPNSQEVKEKTGSTIPCEGMPRVTSPTRPHHLNISPPPDHTKLGRKPSTYGPLENT